ncbi:MAG: DUF6748 domain-containing protein [Byssovorax sp.]
MKNWLTLAALVGVAASSTGCVVDAQVADEGDLSASSRSYVTLRHDNRKCASPMCGGYFIRDVNRATAERYVSGLDLSPANLQPELEDSILAAPAGELVLRGKLGPIEAAHSTRAFLVSEVYRGMPGMAPAEGDVFFTSKTHTPALECFTTPCNNEVATQLNSTKTTSFTSYDVGSALPNGGDAAWLTGRQQTHGAITAGAIVKGAKAPGGYAQVLTASQVYVRLPDVLDPCPKVANPSCPSGKVPTFTRSLDRCLVFDTCQKPGFCPQFLPMCPADYTQTTWAHTSSSCKAMACDPSFLSE